METSCPELLRAQLLQERHQDVPQSPWSIRRFITLEGAFFSGTGQDFCGKSCRNTGCSFHNRRQQPRREYQLQVAILCAVLRQPGKGLFFPVEITYIHILCDCHWGQYSSHRVTAAVFGGNPLPEPGNLTSQGDDDRSLHQACNFPRCKKNFNSPFICPCQPGMSYLLVNRLLQLSASKPQGKKQRLDPLWFSSQHMYPGLFLSNKTSKEPVLGEFINATVSMNQHSLHIRMWWQLPEMSSFNVVPPHPGLILHDCPCCEHLNNMCIS